MRVAKFIDHYQHVVPFGELVVKYAVQFHYFFLYIVPVCYFVFLCISFVCLSVCAAIWRNKGLYIQLCKYDNWPVT